MEKAEITKATMIMENEQPDIKNGLPDIHFRKTDAKRGKVDTEKVSTEAENGKEDNVLM